MFKSQKAEYENILADIEDCYKSQPVLVGTVSIDKNEALSEMLRRRALSTSAQRQSTTRRKPR